ncbi:MAG: transglycosylase SLT domain-containing protein [Polyangiaceae bacterium]|nr:transglycosylase SLT domain-containing protein [Polyangiaceae bacterium]
MQRKHPGRTRIAVGLLLGLLAPGLASVGGGCGCGSAPVTMVTPAAPALSAPAPAPSASASSAEAPPAGPQVDPILADPRVARAARLVEAQDHAGAGAALETLALDASTPAADRSRWLYQAGRQYALAGRAADAHRLFAASAADPWVLASHASFAGAQQALAANRTEEASSLALVAAREPSLEAPADLLLAEVHERRGALHEAIPRWRRYLGASANPPRWAEISLKLARALASRTADPSAQEEALMLARKILTEQPTSASAKAALELEQSLLAPLPPERRQALARRPEDELARGLALVEAGKLKEAEAILAEQTAAPLAGELACKASTLDGKLKTRRKNREAEAAWAEAIQRCTGEARAAALFHGGNASVSAGNHGEAASRFELIEKEFRAHRLADDARLKGALAALALGDEARFSSMLARIGDDYPEGDMTTEGLFRLALHRMGKGDWAAAVAPLEASRKLRPRERDYRAAGRAEYFLARALQATGEAARAAELFREILRDQPLSYYMLLAHARLAEASPPDAASTLDRARSSTAALAPFSLAIPPLQTPPGVRAIELLRQSEFDLARVELTAAKILGPGAPAELQWVAAHLYGISGASVQAHAIPRGRVSDWLEHYPEGGWRSRWELAYPRPYLDIAQREAQRSGIPVSLAYAIMREESAFDPNATSGAPAYGLMQFVMPTAKDVGKKVGLPISEATLKQPATSITLGCRFLADLRARFPDCPALAIPSYNAGAGATRRWVAQRPVEDLDLFVERIPYEETRNYTKRVLKSYAAYLYLYEPHLLPEALRLPLRTQKNGGVAGPPEGE